MLLQISFILLLSLVPTSRSQSFQPCPILGPRFPLPTGLASDSIVQSALKNATATLDELVSTSNSTYGTISSNTTSFSIGLFTSNDPLNFSHPFFYEYNYAAPALSKTKLGTSKLNSETLFRIGTVTEVFTVWVFLIEAGEAYWIDPITKYIPELVEGNGQIAFGHFSWEDVTLGDLARHLSGVPRDYGIADLSTRNFSLPNALVIANRSGCLQPTYFFRDLSGRYPIYLPGTTPIMSNTAFQLLAYALEGIKQQPYDAMFNKTATSIGLSRSSLRYPLSTRNAIIPGANESVSGWSTDFGGEDPAIAMYSTITDISRAGIAMLNSTLISSAMTRRWLKPTAHTSNLVNDAGRPWIIYKSTKDQSPINPVIDIYTSYGSVGLYSSYFGLVPDYNVGFVILAADEASAPDLNVHVDIVADMLLPGLEKAAISQAGSIYSGEYRSNQTAASLIIEKPDGMPGLSLSNFTMGSKDIRKELATVAGISPSALSIRLYPTDLIERTTSGGTKIAFRAVFQDESAAIDAGTPTCITWLSVGALSYYGKPLDLFIFNLSEGQTSLEIPAFNLDMIKER
ncbi:hypothetical protein A1O3_08510 [Capronia epimyces CBS 606.96]|uniref:Uncharacterized protein n=1 Tax=Capronia epimyces CBS 606.96 TaxID=1182542 RepID=W9Y9E7_9EURO|nr:uncharacterized protein A1O3_08510 [Capronia epimyces CBS 606.96]EXJ79009.1 hypothetical protein A1O3_08510 [Capronia epimyces CBS 606.96]